MSAPVVVIGGGRERPGLRDAAGAGRPAGDAGRAARRRSAARPSPASWRPGFRVPAAGASASARCAPTSPATSASARTASSSLPSDVWMTALDGHGRALTLWHDAGEDGGGDRARSRPRRRALAGVRAPPRAGSGGVVASVFDATPPSIDAPAAARALAAAAHGAAVPRPGPRRRLPAAALGADAGGRPGRRARRDTELLKAALAADGVFGSMLGPWSAGSGLLFLLHAANDAAGDAARRLAARRPGRAGRGAARRGDGGRGDHRDRRRARPRSSPTARTARGVRLADGRTLDARGGRVGHRSRSPPSRSAIRWRCPRSCAGAPRTTGRRARSPR